MLFWNHWIPKLQNLVEFCEVHKKWIRAQQTFENAEGLLQNVCILQVTKTKDA